MCIFIIHLLPSAQYVQQGYAIGCVYMYVYIFKTCACIYVTKNCSFSAFLVKNPQKSAHEAFFLHLDIVNVTLDCWFTPDRALLLFFCLRLCAPLGPQGPEAHTRVHSLVGVLLCLQCWLDERVTTTVCCWHLQYSKYFTDGANAVHTGYMYMFCGTPVLLFIAAFYEWHVLRNKTVTTDNWRESLWIEDTHSCIVRH